MRELTTTVDLSYAESVRMALEAHGIRAVVDQPYSRYGSVMGPLNVGTVSVSIVHDHDYDRARTVMAEVVRSPVPAFTRRDARRAGNLLFVVAIVFLVGAAVWWLRGAH